MDIAEICDGDRDGRLHNFLEHRPQVSFANEQRPEPLQPRHRIHVGFQPLLRLRANGDIAGDSAETEQLSRAIKEWDAADFEMNRPPFCIHRGHVQSAERARGFQPFGEQRQGPFFLLRSHEIKRVFPDHFRRLDAQSVSICGLQ